MSDSGIPEADFLALANRLDHLRLVGPHDELEAFARLVHASGPHSAGPFVVLDAGLMPETLTEAELYGHVEAHLDGLHRRRRGRSERACGGTLVLPNVQALGTTAQQRLLRVLDLNVAAPLGADDEAYAVAAATC